MMKRRLIIWAFALLISWPTWLYSQVSGYTFSPISGTYTAVSGGTDVDAIEADDFATSIPIGFTFNFDGTDYTNAVVSSNGWLSFNTSTSSSNFNDLDNSSTAIRPLVAPLWDDLDGRAATTSQASYIVTGTAPNRVFTMEWLNWEWNYGSGDAVMSFQVKLYETTNVVEFVYQQEPDGLNSASASIGLAGASTGTGNFLSLSDASASPTTSSTTETTGINSKPATGQVYRFTPPTCFNPTGLTSTAVASTTVDLSWTAPSSGVPVGYDWEIVPDGDGQGNNVVTSGSTTAPTTTATASGLTAATDYDAYVRTDCGGSDFSGYDGPYSFTTACANYTPPYLEDYTSYVPSCWEEAAGLLANPTSFTSTTSSNWAADGFANVGFSGSAKINIYGTGIDEWLISPTIDLGGGGTQYQLEFDLALTTFGGTGSATLGSDDKFSIVISTNNGVTWQSTNVLQEFNSTTPISNGAGDHITIDLSAYTGLVKIGLYAESTSSNADNDLFVDNFEVVEIPACGDPQSLTATPTSGTSVDLSWSAPLAGTPDDYEWEIVPAGNGQGVGVVATGTIGGAGTSVSVSSGLTATTSYDVYVRTSCAATFNTTYAMASFTTPCAVYAPPYSENFTNGVSTTCWAEWDGDYEVHSGVSFTSTTSSDWFNRNFANGSDPSVAMNLYDFGAGDTEWWVSPEFDLSGAANPQQLTFNAALTTYSGTGTTTFGTQDTFALMVSTDGGTTWGFLNAAYVWHTGNTLGNNDLITVDLTTYAAQTNLRFGFYAERTPASSSPDLNVFVDNFEIDDIPNCGTPIGVAAVASGATSADLSWTVTATGTPTGHEWEVGAAGFTPGTATSVDNGTAGAAATSATATGLSASTPYEAYVRTECGAGVYSSWEGPVAFQILPGDICVTAQDLSTLTSPYSATTTGYTAGDITATGCTGINSSPSRIFYIDVPDGSLVTIRQQSNTYDSYHFMGWGATCPGSNLLVCTDGNEFDPTSWTNTTGSTQRVYWINAGWSTNSGDFVLEWSVSNCFPPTSFAANATSATTIDMSWVAPTSGTPTGYEYLVVLDGATSSGTPQATSTPGAAATSATASGLTAETDYDVYLRTRCGVGNNSAWEGPISVTTPCAAIAPPYTEDFAAGTGATCWTERDGDFEIHSGVSFTSTTGSGWTTDGFANSGFSGAVRNEMYGEDTEWMVSPPFDLSGAANPQQAEFDLAYTVWNTGSATTWGAEDTVALMVSTDGGATWAYFGASYIWSAANTISNTGDHITVDLTAYGASTNLMFAIYSERTPSAFSPDNSIFLDNFEIDDIPSCGDPTAVSVGALTTTTAAISWTAPIAGTPTDYEWEVGGTGFAPGTGAEDVAGAVGGVGTTDNVSGLTAETDYELYVRTVCGVDNSAWVGPVAFTTPCNAISTFPWTETFETASTTEKCWRVIDGGTSDVWDLDDTYAANTGTEAAGIYTDGNGGNNDDWLVSPQLTLTGNEVLKYFMRVRSSFEPNDFELLLSTASSDPADFTTTLLPNTSYSNTSYIEYTVPLTAYTGNVYLAWHVPNGGLDGWDLFIDDVTVEPAPACSDPSGISASVTGATTADLNWTVGIGTTHTWELGAQGFAPGTGAELQTGTTTALVGTASLTGLSLSTTYDAYVNIDCNAGTWVGPVTFEILPGDLCATAIDLSGQTSPYSGTTAGYTAGDINITAGAGCTRAANSPNVIMYIDVNDGEQLTLRSDGTFDSYHYVGYGPVAGTCPGTTQLTCADTDDLTTTWLNNTGSAQRVYLVQGRYSPTGGSTTFDIYFDIATCIEPSGLTEDAVSGTTIDFSYSAPSVAPAVGYEYLVVLDGAGTAGTPQATGSIAGGATLTGQATGLSPATAYDTYVRSDCGGSDYSAWIGPLSSTTACVVLSPPYTQDFSAGTGAACWEEWDGDFDLGVGVTFTSTTSSGWLTDGFGNVGTTGAVRNEMYGTDTEWMISPEFDLSGAANPQQVEFDVAMTNWSTTAASTFGAEDTFALMISTDGGATWDFESAATIWSAANTLSNTGQRITVDLTAYAAATNLRFGFYSERTPSSFSPDINVYVDNFEIEDIPNCGDPTGAAVAITGATTADLSWIVTTQGVPTGHEWEYGNAGFAPGTGAELAAGTAGAAATSASFTGLSAGTSYEAYVRTECGAGVYSAWAGPIAFEILPGDICATAVDLNALTSPYSGTTAGYTAGDITITAASGCTRAANSPNFVAYVDVPNGAQLSFRSDGTFDSYHYVGYGPVAGPCPGTSQLTCVDTDDFTTTWTNNEGSTQRVYVVQGRWSPTGSATTFDLIWDIITCIPPTSVTATPTTATTADLSWTADASATSGYEWKVVLDGAGVAALAQASGTTGAGVTTATATGLASQTDYDLYVRSDCGSGTFSAWTSVVSFTTPCPAFTPPYTQDFSSYVPACWSEAAGPVGNPTVFTSTTSSLWTSDGLGNVGSSGAAKINIFSTGRDEWLISPSIDLGTGTTTYKVSFDHANTNFGSTTASTLNNDDRVLFLISTDNGVTWNESNALRVWDASSSIAELNGSFEYVLNGFTGVVQFAFYAESFVSGGDEDFSVDNFLVEEFICTDGYWEGTVNTDWTNSGNWCNGTVPTPSIDVTIPPGVPNYPNILDGQTVFANSIDISAGGILDFTPTIFAGTPSYGTLEVAGNIANSGTLNSGNVTMNGSSPQTITGNNSFFNLRIENGSGVSVSGGQQDVYGGLLLIDGVFTSNNTTTIKSTADYTGYVDDFTDATPGSISGLIRVERYVNNMHNGFSFIGAGVTSASIGDWSGEFSTAGLNGGTNFSFVIPKVTCDPDELRSDSPYGGLFDYIESAVTTCNQAGWRVRTAGSLNPGDGYAGVIPNGTVADVFGFAATGSYTTGTLTYTAGNTSGSVGFNMIANPYPSPIDWNDVAAANPGIQGAAYVFQASGPYLGTYVAVNSLSPANIASGQAFFVEVDNSVAASTTVSFNNTMRETGSDEFFRNSAAYDAIMKLDVVGNGHADKTTIAFGENFTSGRDRDYDAGKMASMPGYAMLYTATNPDYVQSINALPVNGSVNVIPMGFKPGANGTYTFTASELETFAPTSLIILEDKLTGTFQNLMENDTYTFTSDEMDDEMRFNIHFIPATAYDVTDVDCQGADGSVLVDFGTHAIGANTFAWDAYEVTDAAGNVMANGTNANGAVTVANLPVGTYTLAVSVGNYSVTDEIIVDAAPQVTAAFTADNLQPGTGELVNFTNTTAGATTYEWNMGDGTTYTGVANPSHIYNQAGIYQVELIVSNDDCSDRIVQTVEVQKTTGIPTLQNDGYRLYSFNDQLRIEFADYNADTKVDMYIYDMLGKEIAVEKGLTTGNSQYQFTVEANSDVAYYIVRLVGEKTNVSRTVSFGNAR